MVTVEGVTLPATTPPHLPLYLLWLFAAFGRFITALPDPTFAFAPYRAAATATAHRPLGWVYWTLTQLANDTCQPPLHHLPRILWVGHSHQHHQPDGPLLPRTVCLAHARDRLPTPPVSLPHHTLFYTACRTMTFLPRLATSSVYYRLKRGNDIPLPSRADTAALRRAANTASTLQYRLPGNLGTHTPARWPRPTCSHPTLAVPVT